MPSSKEAGLSVPVIGICCAIEAELMALPPEERKEFLESLGIAEAAFGRVIRASFTLLGRIAYFTVGEDEVKAWIIPAGCKAPRAAAVIHNDFERGFIKAEVIGYDEFIACGGSQCRRQGGGKAPARGQGVHRQGRRYHQLPLQRLKKDANTKALFNGKWVARFVNIQVVALRKPRAPSLRFCRAFIVSSLLIFTASPSTGHLPSLVNLALGGM